jgi:hypothetical protein
MVLMYGYFRSNKLINIAVTNMQYGINIWLSYCHYELLIGLTLAY